MKSLMYAYMRISEEVEDKVVQQLEAALRTIYSLPDRPVGQEHVGAHGARLTGAEMTGLCEAVLGRAR